MQGSVSALFDRIIHGDRVSLGLALTLVESERPADREQSVQLLEWCEKKLHTRDESIRFAISGSPGAGKSSLIEVLGLTAINQGHKVGVVTVDPSSSISHGSILGDKSRMPGLSVSPSAFIRSSAAGSVLGGLGRRSHEMMTLMAVAGYNFIFLETVGVGQSEHTAWQLADGFILVLSPGGGDELQGIKRGVTELSDLIIVNKSDGALSEVAKTAKMQYQNAIHYLTPQRKYWIPQVVSCSAIEGTGIQEVWELFCAYKDNFSKDNNLVLQRRKQKSFWLSWSLGMTAHQLLLQHPAIQVKLSQAQDVIEEGTVSLFRTELDIENEMKRLITNSYQNAG